MKTTIINLINKNKFLRSFFSNKINFLRLYFNKPDKNFDEIFSNVINGEMLVNVKNIEGNYTIDCRSHLLKRVLLSKEYEPSLVNLIKVKTNSSKDAINIGANIGLYTCLLGNILNNNQKVLAIEPTENAFNLLLKNINQNNLNSKVITFNGVASDKQGTLKINLFPGNEEYSSLGEIIHPAIKDKEFISVEVKSQTIDNLVEKHNLEPGIIIIDVEGAEMQVLLGGVKTIKKFNPIIISEIDDLLLEKMGSNSKEIFTFLKDHHYVINEINNENLEYPFEGNIIATSKNFSS